MFCENCGQQVNDDIKFCPFCGYDNGGNPAYANPVAAPPQKKKKTGLIIGLSVGGFLTIAALAFGIWWFAFRDTEDETDKSSRRESRKESTKESEEESESRLPKRPRKKLGNGSEAAQEEEAGETYEEPEEEYEEEAEAEAEEVYDSYYDETSGTYVTQVSGYRVITPAEYPVEFMDEGYAVFTANDGSQIGIFMASNTDGYTGDYIFLHGSDLADEFYTLALEFDPAKNGGITNTSAIRSGDFEGVRAQYASGDRDLREIWILANKTDIVYIVTLGVNNAEDVFHTVDILH